MIHKLLLLAILSLLSACAGYREPSVNCFSAAAVSSGDAVCDFTPLGSPDLSERTLA